MWIKIEVIPQEREVIYLPERIMSRHTRMVRIKFGKKNALVHIMALDEAGDNSEEDGTFEKPVKIMISDKLASRLLIYTSLKYQMKFNYNIINIGPTIGLLLGDHSYAYNPIYMKKYSDRLGVYDKIGGLICAFSSESVDWEDNSVYGLYYNIADSKWEYGKFPIPSVIYRRNFHSKSPNVKKLIAITNNKMFNSWRFTKIYMYRYLMRNGRLIKHLPPTSKCVNYNQIKQFINKHGSVILKPISLSRGRGICIINQVSNGYKALDYRNNSTIETDIVNDVELRTFFEENAGFFKNYLIQKHLKLAKVDGQPYDIRVVMQKEQPHKWKCSGIECRVAAKKTLLTNISRGGYALTIDKALGSSFNMSDEQREEKKQQLDSLCLRLCEHLDRIGYHFAEFGIDIAIDEEGTLWIIEVNVFPSFKGFKLIDYKTYLNIRYAPLLYAANLSGFSNNTEGRGDNDELFSDINAVSE